MTAKPTAILLGSKPGAAVALAAMLDRGWDVRAVVPSGTKRQEWIAGETVADVAARRGVTVRAKQEDLDDVTADYVISYMYRFLVKRPTLDRAARAAVNFHAGPLPEFGGWAFYNVAILEGADTYGCTCHHMDEGFDTGDLVHVRRFPIDARRETAVSLERRAQQEMVRLFLDFCLRAESGEPLPRIPQDRARHRYMTREEFEKLKRIPPGADAETVDRHARAFWFPPFACAWVEVDGVRCEVVPECAKRDLAGLYHRDDLEDLRHVAAAHTPAPWRAAAKEEGR